MISSAPFHIDSSQQEIFLNDQETFPYICFYRKLNPQSVNSLSWHWHSALEIDYVEEGEAEFHTLSQNFTVKKGQLIFINSNVIHSVSSNSSSGCKLYAHLFHPKFLCGTYTSIFFSQYILPVIRRTDLPVLQIVPDTYQGLRMAESFLQAVELSRREPFGYELLLRSELSGFWLLLLEKILSIPESGIKKSGLDTDRLKQMLTYIHQNYSQHITLDMIAASASISTRECSRCFQRCLKLSPVTYLNQYRIHQAASQLLNTTDTVLTISENCGFSSGSYFGKLFHRVMGCTPKEYRKK